jgi:hypothetical protein
MLKTSLLLGTCCLSLCLPGSVWGANVVTSYLINGWAEDWVPGYWSLAANWSPSTYYPDNGNGGQKYNVVITRLEQSGPNPVGVRLTEDITVNSLLQEWSGHVDLQGFDFKADQLLAKNPDPTIRPDVAFVGPGTVSVKKKWETGGLYMYYGAVISSAGSAELGLNGGNIYFDGVIENKGYMAIHSEVRSPAETSGQILNSGYLDATQALFAGLGEENKNLRIENMGRMKGGAFMFSVVRNRGILEGGCFFNIGSELVNEGTIIVKNNDFECGAGSSFTFTKGEIILEGGRQFKIYQPDYTLGELIIPKSGKLEGDGILAALVTNNGLMAPSAIGSFSMSGLALESTSKLRITLGRPTPFPGAEDNYDPYLAVYWGGAALGGTMDLDIAEGFETQITPSDKFVILGCWVGSPPAEITGEFVNAPDGTRVPVMGGQGSFQIIYDKASYPQRVYLTDFQSSQP